jgi:diacylglycerol kinase family enzyme
MNPTAGGGRLLRAQAALSKAAAESGVDLEMWATGGPGHATELAAKAAAEDLPLVFAFGGDGTYNEVAQGLLGSTTVMGVLPGGTTSVLAYELAVPRPASLAVTALLAGEDRAMRVGRSDRGDLVLLMLSAGPDSHVLERLRPSFKKLGGRIGVALQAVVETMGATSLPKMRVVTDSSTLECGWVIVGNARCYGGRHCATPGADPFRGDLEVVVQRTTGRRAAAAFLLGIPRGRHVHRTDVLRETVTRVMIEPAQPEAAVSYQVDGDVVGVLPVETVVDPQPLWVRVPVEH